MVHKVTHDQRGSHMTLSDHHPKPIDPRAIDHIKNASKVGLAATQFREKALLENVEHPTKQSLQRTMRAHEAKMRQLGVQTQHHPHEPAPTTLQLRMTKLRDEVGFLEEMANRRPPSVISTRHIPLNRLQLPHDNWRRLLVTRERPGSQHSALDQDQFAAPVAQLTGRIAQLEVCPDRRGFAVIM